MARVRQQAFLWVFWLLFTSGQCTPRKLRTYHNIYIDLLFSVLHFRNVYSDIFAGFSSPSHHWLIQLNSWNAIWSLDACVVMNEDTLTFLSFAY